MVLPFYITYINVDLAHHEIVCAKCGKGGINLVIPQGGTLIFSTYVGSGPASTVHSKKISGISSTPKKYLKF